MFKYIHIYQVVDAWEVNVVINYEQCLKATQALVTKLGYSSIILSIWVFLFSIPFKVKFGLGAVR